MTNTKEQTVVWKQYPEISFIEANQFGEIRTVDHYTTRSDGRKRFVKGHILKQFDDGRGYMQVYPCVNGKRVALKAHRVVAACFLPNPDNLPEVNHKDNNPKNNSVSNLEFCTPQYNTAYREKYGTPAKESTKVLRKPLFAVELKTLKVSCFESQHEAARQLGASVGNINKVLKSQRNQAGGFWFCCADENAVEKTRARFGNDVADEIEKLMNEDHN